jgi:hypothetical protein
VITFGALKWLCAEEKLGITQQVKIELKIAEKNVSLTKSAFDLVDGTPKQLFSEASARVVHNSAAEKNCEYSDQVKDSKNLVSRLKGG